MFVDKQLLLSDSQDLSQAAAAYLSTNAIDLGVAGRDLGRGKPVAVVICVDEAFTSDGAATVAFALVSDDDEALGSPTTLYTTPAIAYTELTEGKIIVLPFPQGRMASTDRYVGVEYTIGTATTTAGKVSAFVASEWPSVQ